MYATVRAVAWQSCTINGGSDTLSALWDDCQGSHMPSMCFYFFKHFFLLPLSTAASWSWSSQMEGSLWVVAPGIALNITVPNVPCLWEYSHTDYGAIVGEKGCFFIRHTAAAWRIWQLYSHSQAHHPCQRVQGKSLPLPECIDWIHKLLHHHGWHCLWQVSPLSFLQFPKLGSRCWNAAAWHGARKIQKLIFQIGMYRDTNLPDPKFHIGTHPLHILIRVMKTQNKIK